MGGGLPSTEVTGWGQKSQHSGRGRDENRLGAQSRAECGVKPGDCPGASPQGVVEMTVHTWWPTHG